LGFELFTHTWYAPSADIAAAACAQVSHGPLSPFKEYKLVLSPWAVVSITGSAMVLPTVTFESVDFDEELTDTTGAEAFATEYGKTVVPE
jgi:hypothetical protein